MTIVKLRKHPGGDAARDQKLVAAKANRKMKRQQTIGAVAWLTALKVTFANLICCGE